MTKLYLDLERIDAAYTEIGMESPVRDDAVRAFPYRGLTVTKDASGGFGAYVAYDVPPTQVELPEDLPTAEVVSVTYAAQLPAPAGPVSDCQLDGGMLSICTLEDTRIDVQLVAPCLAVAQALFTRAGLGATHPPTVTDRRERDVPEEPPSDALAELERLVAPATAASSPARRSERRTRRAAGRRS